MTKTIVRSTTIVPIRAPWFELRCGDLRNLIHFSFFTMQFFPSSHKIIIAKHDISKSSSKHHLQLKHHTFQTDV